MKSRINTTVKLHPISTVLLVSYLFISILHGTLELFLVGFLASSAAYVLELLFCETGMIRTGRYCAGRPRATNLQGRKKQKRKIIA